MFHQCEELTQLWASILQTNIFNNVALNNANYHFISCCFLIKYTQLDLYSTEFPNHTVPLIKQFQQRVFSSTSPKQTVSTERAWTVTALHLTSSMEIDRNAWRYIVRMKILNSHALCNARADPISCFLSIVRAHIDTHPSRAPQRRKPSRNTLHHHKHLLLT